MISPNRTLPVILATQINPIRYPKRRFSFTLDDQKLAKNGQGLAWLKLEHGFSISSSQVGKQGDQYYVTYPLNEQKMQFLEYHLRKGIAKDDRFCLAIYFFWDEQEKKWSWDGYQAIWITE